MAKPPTYKLTPRMEAELTALALTLDTIPDELLLLELTSPAPPPVRPEMWP